jgi:hypothetical protein
MEVVDDVKLGKLASKPDFDQASLSPATKLAYATSKG